MIRRFESLATGKKISFETLHDLQIHICLYILVVLVLWYIGTQVIQV